MAHPLGLDPKKFKHVKSDDKSTTLQHQDGHILTIAHSGLSKENRAQLQALTQLGQSDPIKKYAEGDVVKPEMSAGDKAKAFMAQAKDDPTLQNMLHGIAMGGVGSVEGKAMEEALPMAENFGKTIIKDAPEAIKDFGKTIVKDTPEQPIGKVIRTDTPTPYGFADGGDVKTKTQYGQDESSPDVGRSTKGKPSTQEDIKATEQTPENGIKNLKAGVKELFGYADGGDVQTPDINSIIPQPPGPPRSEDPNFKQPEQSADSAITPDVMRKREIYNRYASNPQNQFGPQGQAPAKFDAPIWHAAEEDYAKEQSNNADQAAIAQQVAIKENTARTAAGLPTVDVPNVPQQNQQPASDLNPAPMPPNTPMPQDAGQGGTSAIPGVAPSMAPNDEMLMRQGIKEQTEGLTKEAEEQGNLGTAKAAALETAANANMLAQTKYQEHFNNLEAERQGLMQDIKDGRIDPEQFWHGDKDGNGGHSKIAAAIGMIISGFNPTSSPNAAINYLHQQMENNLSAQAKNLDSKQNLLRANFEQFHNLKDAADMTRIMQADMVSDRLMQAAATAQGPIAKQQAIAAAGAIKQAYAPKHMELALRQSMLGMFNNPGSGGVNGGPHGDPMSPETREAAWRQANQKMMFLNPEFAKAQQEKHVPFIGDASIPVPESAKSQMVAARNVNDLFNRSLQFASQPIPKNPADYVKYKSQADTVQQQLIGSIKQAQHDGVYKESEAEFLLKQIGDSPASMFRSFSSVPKIKELQEIKQQEFHNLLNQYGLPQQRLPQAPQGPQYKTVNGVKYMRGPNGQAIRVK